MPDTALFAPATVELRPLIERGSGLRRWITPVLSLAILAAALWQLRHLDLGMVFRDLPASPAFWLVFVAGYMALPVGEWLIYRRLWQLPATGLGALLRKRIANEIVLGYSGEVYFYGWARRHARLAAAPFGVIKDVTILSATVANAITVALMLVTWPLLSALNLGLTEWVMALATAIIALPSLIALLMGRRLFSCKRRELWMIASVHLGRIAVVILLTALMWRLAMPGVPILWWLVLATLRMLVSRLPLLPNRDIVFAGLVAFVIGDAPSMSAMLVMVAGLTLATHIFLGAALGVADLVRSENRA